MSGNGPMGIVVVGESMVDWIIAQPPGRSEAEVDARGFWTMFAGPGISSVPGGAAIDTVLLQETSQRSGAGVPVIGPVIPRNILTDPDSPEVIRSFSSWEPLPRTIGSKEYAWRLSRFIGLHQTKHASDALKTGSIDFQPSCVLVEDGNHHFRHDREQWLPLIEFAEAQIVVRQTGALGTGPLWEYLIDHAADRTTLFCNVSDLRKEGAPIGQPLSWERTAQDVVSAIVQRPALQRVQRVVVAVGISGAVIVNRDTPNVLIYDPISQEGDWAERRPGQIFGTGTMILNALVWELGSGKTEIDFPCAIVRGVRTGRLLHDHGFQAESTERGAKIDYPFERLATSLASGSGYEGPIEQRAISPDPGWRLLDSIGSFRGAAEQITRLGVDQVSNEIPLETMGNWASVDRIEIESMRSVRNIISEYLARPVRQRPLSLAVFGPPGAGKSFAIKQMASVITGGHQVLGSLEFNLSQFHGIEELPGAFQQIRDLRLRERLPLVFWDEFDTALDGQELGWVVNFLAPMQDGAFTENGVTRPIGPAIFIFAGGTHATMDSFKSRALELPGAKATDFLSRLRGYVDVLGPNPFGPGDRTWQLRRAILLRSILQRTVPQIFEDGEMRIARSLLDAFLDVPEYLHGSRSMEAVIEMSAITRKPIFERSALPAIHQLALHVDAAEFMRIVDGRSPVEMDN